ncbi:MAG: transposase [Planctomycetia bacterium]|nr:transposase [Planctomycetia bacterium]
MYESPEALQTRVAAYARAYAADFRRRDQARWLEIYLHGLLTAAGRKTVETLIRHAQRPDDLAVGDPAQALQNFINQSPWDEQKVLRRCRQHLARQLGSPTGIYVIHDIGFPKQGQRSVGVLRQYCPELRRKLNCQVAVAVSYIGPAGVCPLGLQLYLPRPWLSDAGRLRAAGAPLEQCSGSAKAQIALAMLRAIRADGVPGSLVLAGGNYGTSSELRRWLEEQGLCYLLGVGEDQIVLRADGTLPGGYFTSTSAGAQPSSIRELARRLPPAASDVPSHPGGLRCVAGAVWPDLKHDGSPVPGSCPVRLFAQDDGHGYSGGAFGKLLEDTSCAEAARLWGERQQADTLYGRLRQELGLDHFEGRSWRGFHHHAALVIAAYGFLVNPALPTERPNRSAAIDGFGGKRLAVHSSLSH